MNGRNPGAKTLTWPDDAALLPFLPMVYVAWADGNLTEEQLLQIGERLQEFEGFDAHAREVVREWLDPAQPPPPAALERLLASIKRSAKRLGEDERYSLAEFGLSLVPPIGAGTADDDAQRATMEALSDVEAALGIVGNEAAREMLADPSVRLSRPLPVVEAPFDVAGMTAILDEPYGDVRRRVRDLLGDDRFTYRYGMSRHDYREVVLSWVETLADAGLGSLGLPEKYGGADDYGAFIASFETLAFHDTSLVIKFGVQFGLFGGSVLFLGTERHHERYLHDIGTLTLPGCFAMTELGHGSNVWDIETIARFDSETEEFVVTTPTDTARKEWIGNAAAHGRLATVFAQLEVDGERHGVHALLVRIRDDAGNAMPGVRLEDCGEKEGLNGIDNGRIWFDDVRVPRVNLLNRFGDVSSDGEYSSPISSQSKRFFTMLGTLVGGRVSVAAASVSAAKTGLAVAVRYTGQRRQFGPAGEPEFAVLDYTTVQRRLMPRLAMVYALDAAVKYVTRRFLTRTDDNAREIEALAAGLKAYASWNTVDTLQACREVCGGQGYLAANRLPAIKADTDVFTTFEGDNTVLMQLVAKAKLTSYKLQFEEMRLWGVLKLIADRATTALSQLNPVVTRQTDESHLRDPDFHANAFRYREERLLASVARRLRRRIEEGIDTFVAFNECQDHLVALANASVERMVAEQMYARVNECPDPSLRRPLETMRDLYALWRIEQDRGWFLESGYLEGNKAKAIRTLVSFLCGEVRDVSLPLVNAFGIPDTVLGAPIAFGIDPRSGGRFVD